MINRHTLGIFCHLPLKRSPVGLFLIAAGIVLCIERSSIGFQKEDIQLDASTLIESLANQSKPGEGRHPKFDDFQIAEAKRINSILEKLGKNIEPFVHLLRESFDDARYCRWMTAYNEFETKFTIGEVCHDILGETLTYPYYLPYKRGGSKMAYMNIVPFFMRMDREKFKSWLQERDHLSLRGLQIDAGKEMRETFERLLMAEKDEKVRLKYEGYIVSIGKTIEILENSKTAILSENGWSGLRRFP